MNSVFAFVVGLLQAALSLLGFVQAHPELPQASRDQATQVAQQAITQATQVLSSQQTVQTNRSIRFTATPTTGAAPLSIWFSAALSNGTKDSQSEYSIDFGDGTSQVLEWENGKGTPDAWFLKAYHIYTSPGTYAAKVGSTCTSRSCTKVTWLSTATITVSGGSTAQTKVDSIKGPTLVVVGQENTWNVISSGATQFAAIWGDGTYAGSLGASGIPSTFGYEPNLKHIFTTAGTYHVQFFAKNGSSVDVKMFDVTVTTP